MATPRAKKVLGTFGPGSTHMVGDGFHVRNLFPSNPLGERISPFLLLDYAGPTYYAPSDRTRGVGEHPHRGFETVTIIYQGGVEHRDSAGNSGRIGPGDVQWMTAASGVVHEEMHARELAARGGTLQMVQLWVNLPRESKMSPPRYQEIAAERIPAVELPDGAGRVRVIAGRLGETAGPAEIFTDLNVWDLRLAGGREARLHLPDGHNAAAVVLEGAAGAEDSPAVGDAHLILFDREGHGVTLRAKEDAVILLLSGEPLGEPVVSHGPFVMNTGEEIHRAIKDYQSGEMGHLSPADPG